MKRYLVFTCFLSIRQIVLKFVPEYESDLRKLLSMIQAEDCTDIDITKIIELTEKMKKYIYNEDDPLCAIVNQAEVFIKCIQKD